MKLMRRNISETPMWLPEIFDNLLTYNWETAKGYSPAINIKETTQAYTIEIAAIGIKKEEFKLSIHEDILTLKIEHTENHEEKNENFLRKDFTINSFQQNFNLPKDIDKDKISANTTNGILYINLPKLENTQTNTPRCIEIQ